MKKKIRLIMVIAAVNATGALFFTGGVELLRYSPYEDPGALATGVWFLLSALSIAIVTLAATLGPVAFRAVRAYLSWRRSLTPGARIAIAVAEAMAMDGAHRAWSRHNREVSARLTSSVMGDPPGAVTRWPLDREDHQG